MPLQTKFMQKDEKGRTLWMPQISDYQHSPCKKDSNSEIRTNLINQETVCQKVKSEVTGKPKSLKP